MSPAHRTSRGTALLWALIATLASSAWASDRGLTATSETKSVKRALVIGNQRYFRGALENSRKDALDVGKQLEQLGFEVLTKTDLTRKEMAAAIDTWTESLRANDVTFFYYSGHGVVVKDGNYLIPVDFSATKEADVPDEAYALDKLTRRLDERNLALSVIVLDACRDNPFLKKRSGSGGLAPFDAGTGTLISFATAPGQTASDGAPGGNGLYTSALLQRLPEANVDIDALFKQVREDVYLVSNRTQVPWTTSSVMGKYCLAGTACGTGTPAAVAKVSPMPTPAPTTPPKLLLAVREQYTNQQGKRSETTQSTLRPAFESALIGKGFGIVDQARVAQLRSPEGDTTALVRAAGEQGVDYLISLEGDVQYTSTNDLGLGEFHGSGEVTLTAVDVSTGQVIASEKRTGPSPPNCYREPELPTKTIAHVGLPLIDSLVRRVQSAWSNRQTDGLRFLINLVGVKSAKKQSLPFQKLVNELPGVARVNQLSTQNGRLELELFAAKGTDASKLQDAILAAAPRVKTLKELDLKSAQGRQLTFTLDPG